MVEGRFRVMLDEVVNLGSRDLRGWSNILRETLVRELVSERVIELIRERMASTGATLELQKGFGYKKQNLLHTQRLMRLHTQEVESKWPKIIGSVASI